MREISCEEIIRTVRDLCIEANCSLPEDLRECIQKAALMEESPVGRDVLGDMRENCEYAARRRLPVCQDTGMAVIFCDVGQDVHIVGGLLSEAVDEGVRQGYTEGFLRKSVVLDPLRRINTDDNTPAVLHVRLIAGESIKITVAPKGFGSENMSAMKMFTPSASAADIEDFVVETVSSAGSNPCPPVVLGVGLGGTVERCAENAKRAIATRGNIRNADPFYAEMEERILSKINRLGIGPQGLGGRVTALYVNIEPAPTHIAGLPCVVNMSCHVTRHASAII
jgi:fumarate hydratase subunit alpha